VAPRDYYQVLGVPREADKKQIAAAFRKLARQHHPDVNPGNRESERRFKEISEANEVLSDPEKRRLYDTYGHDWQAAQAAGAAAGSARPGARTRGEGRRVRYQTIDPDDLQDLFGSREPYSEFFHSIFGGRGEGGQATPTSRAPVEVEGVLTISLSEAYHGSARTFELPDGRRIELKVPAGVPEGTVLRAGDLRARVEITRDPVFERDGDDLRVAVTVPLKAALLGGEVEVPTIKGGRVRLNVPAETQNGTRLRLRGLGMPKRGGAHGDLFAEVKVQLPVPMSDAARRWAREMPDE
jgi:curved DNA-binding protein